MDKSRIKYTGLIMCYPGMVIFKQPDNTAITYKELLGLKVNVNYQNFLGIASNECKNGEDVHYYPARPLDITAN